MDIWDYPLFIAPMLGLVSTVHCVGMCGGIMGMLSMSLPLEVRSDRVHLFGYTLAYNLGRLVSYGLAGVVLGLLSGAFVEYAAWGGGLNIPRLFTSVLVILVGLYLAGWFPRLTMVEHLGRPLWRRMEPLGKRLLPVRSPFHALLFGMVWGWLPCGPVYSALALSLTSGSAWGGGLFMLGFGVGTLPVLVAAGFLVGLSTRMRKMRYLKEIAGGSLVLMGVVGLLFAVLPHDYTLGHDDHQHPVQSIFR